MDFLSQDLAELESQHLLRVPVPLESLSPVRARLRGREIQIFCSNDYLGLRMNSQVLMVAKEALERYGAGSGSARQVSGDFPVHRELESGTAQFLGVEATLLFSSGYLANLGAIPALAGDGDLILSDEKNHASLIDACRLSKAKTEIYRHADSEDLGKRLRKSQAKRIVVVTESLFSMDGDLAPLDEIVALKKSREFFLFVDDAHAIGALGKTGRGAAEHFQLAPGSIDARMGTYSKALASQGAFIAGSSKLIAFLRNHARSYLFDTSLSPVCAAAAHAALEQLKLNPQLPQELQQLSGRIRSEFEDLLPASSTVPTPIIPFIVGSAEKAMSISSDLLEQGFYLQGIRPPTVPEGASRLRLTACLGHSSTEWSQFQTVLKSALSRFLG